MASSLSAKKMELLRRLATKEATRRQQLQSAEITRESSPNEVAGPSSVTIEEVDAFEEENRQLEQILQEERARNDVEWEKVQQKLASLDPVPLNVASVLTGKENELAMLEHEIKELSEDLPRLDPPQSDFVLSLTTRLLISSAIEQSQAGMLSKKKELEMERNLLQQDEQTWFHLRDVQRGLELKRERLKQQKTEKRNQQSVLTDLKGDVRLVEKSIKSLTTFLMEFCDDLFEEDNAIEDQRNRKGYQLRHLIDVLVNRAYDYPENAWVDVSQRYPPAIVTFLVRANIAIEHPRDARNLRLVDFSK